MCMRLRDHGEFCLLKPHGKKKKNFLEAGWKTRQDTLLSLCSCQVIFCLSLLDQNASGLLAKPTHGNIIRLAPPLCINEVFVSSSIPSKFGPCLVLSFRAVPFSCRVVSSRVLPCLVSSCSWSWSWSWSWSLYCIESSCANPFLVSIYRHKSWKEFP